ncbi:MAG: hypothetical protein H7175_22980, partial [Burkholderiales bacterium]|nr:hypothetical protein [Anaerolineae bacterium]
GDYMALAAAPSGYGLTTADQLLVQVRPGASINVVFGAAEGVQPVVPPPADSGGLTADQADAPTPALTDQLFNVSGLIIFGLAALVLVGGLAVTFMGRRR